MTWYAFLAIPSADDGVCATLSIVASRLARERGGIALDLGKGDAALMHHLATQAQTLITPEGTIPPAVGIATSRVVAALAAQHALPGSVQLILPADCAAFLAPLPVSDGSIAPAIVARLHTFGLHTLGQLAALPLDALQAQFGAAGRTLYVLARGHDLAPFAPEPAAPTLRLARHFASPVADRRVLDRALGQLSTQLCGRLDARGWAAGTLALTVELDDDPPSSVVRPLAQPSSQERLIRQQLAGMLSNVAITSGVTALWIAVPHLLPRITEQLMLIPPEQGQVERLAAVLHALSPRGRNQLVRATIAAPDAYLAEQRVRLTPWDER